MNETDFVRAADRTIASIGEAIDAALEESDVDLDWSVNEGVLEITCEDASKLIVNRHVANREIWVAARSGGFHFRIDGDRWRDTRSGEELGAALARLIEAQGGLAVDLGSLRATPSD